MKNRNYGSVFKDTREILKLISGISKSYFPLVIVKNALQATIPYVNIMYGYLILDEIVSKASKEVILNNVYWMISLNLVLGLLLSFFTRSSNVRTEYVNHTMKSEIARKAQTLDYEQLEKKESLELLKRAEEGAKSHGGIKSFCETIGELITHIITIIYSVILLGGLFIVVPKENPSMMERIFNSPFILIALVFLFVGALIVSFSFAKKINEEAYGFFEKNVGNNRIFAYYLGLSNNYNFGKDIRIYEMSDMIEEEMKRANGSIEKMMRELSVTFGKYGSLTEVINQLMIFTAYGYVGIKAILGLITIGSILKYISTLVKFIGAVSNISSCYTSLDMQRQYLNNYCLFLKVENKKYKGTLPIEKRDDNEYELEFRNVSFHYPNSDNMILNNISLKLKVGNKMAIVGRNGAGKTTFIKLLCRLYDPTEGEILLNGINIKKYDYSEYLKIFSVVFQDFKLFSFDIGQNVAASTLVEEAEVWVALKRSGAGEFVKKMQKGIHTNIYQNQEEGVEISGGEAQKIAIARALYKAAPVVILDEPTSALDPVAEYEIYERFHQMVSEKTSIYISHRMSSCRFCDNIVVFDNGQIVQTGNHDTLIKDEGGLYNKLWTAQAKYYN